VSGPTLQALIPADHIYRDEGSGKYVVAGTFHQVNVAEFPGRLDRSVGLFVSLRGVSGPTELSVAFVSEDGEVLLSSRALSLEVADPGLPVELAIELPPLPLPRPGRYFLRLGCDGAPVGEALLVARSAA
jgi:hypothetical protein